MEKMDGKKFELQPEDVKRLVRDCIQKVIILTYATYIALDEKLTLASPDAETKAQNIFLN